MNLIGRERTSASGQVDIPSIRGKSQAHKINVLHRGAQALPAISVLVDGQTIATVNTDGLDVLSVVVNGSTTDDEFAVLEMHGGAYPEDGEPTHLIWINTLKLQPGQSIEVRVLDSGITTPRGKTIEELFPNEAIDNEPREVKSAKAIFDELREKPTLREGFALHLQASGGISYAGRTAPTDHSFAFHVLWSAHRPDRASVSLHASTVDEIENRSPIRDMARGHIGLRENAVLRIDRLVH